LQPPIGTERDGHDDRRGVRDSVNIPVVVLGRRGENVSDSLETAKRSFKHSLAIVCGECADPLLPAHCQ